MLVFLWVIGRYLLGKHTDVVVVGFLSNRCPINPSSPMLCSRSQVGFSELEGLPLFYNGIVHDRFRNVRYVDVCTTYGIRLTRGVFDLTNHLSYSLSGGCLCGNSSSGEVWND